MSVTRTAPCAQDGGAEGDEFGGVLKKRAGGAPHSEDLDDGDQDVAAKAQPQAQLAPAGKKKKDKLPQEGPKGAQLEQLLGAYFGGGRKGKGSDDGDEFLKEYILNKGWVDKDDRLPTYQEVRG